MTSPRRTDISEQDVSSGATTGRPVVYGTQGVISSGHYLTSMAGMRMLVAGGNAFDALVAAAFAAAVVESIASYSLAAESVFMLYDDRSGDLLSLSGQGVAPAAATVDYYRSLGHDTVPTGPGDQAHLAITVPGVVHALVSLLERYGTRTVGEVLAPSVHYAQHGIPFYEYLVERLDAPTTREQFDQYPPGGTPVFFPNGDLPRAGSMLVQMALGDTLKKMIEAENAAGGSRLDGLRAARSAFYEGEIARTIVDGVQRVGGVLSMDDLAGYRSKFEQPAKTTFMGHEIYGQTTWTQGPVLMQALNMLERFDLKSMGHNSPQYIHTVCEALKYALADRQTYYGDPDFSAVPLDGLLSKEYAEERARLIDPNRAVAELPSAGNAWAHSSRRGQAAAAPAVAGGADGGGGGDTGGTTHIAVIDRDGNLACATPSGGAFDKSVFLPDLGCALSTRMEMFNFQDGHPNALVPGKRPRTTLINYILSKGGTPVMTVGCPGGDHQAQANVQLILNTLVFGMNPQEAIEAPRFATQSVTNSFYPHEYYPGRLQVEERVPADTVSALEAMGHEVARAVTCGVGATVARRDPETGAMSSGGDPRRASYAIGW